MSKRYTLDTVIKELNHTLEEKQPQTISSSWVFFNTPHVYRYIQKNIRTENDAIDWDKVTQLLDRSFAKRWIRYKYKRARLYEKQSEVDLVLERYKDQLYIFICTMSKEDRIIQNRMVVNLVRLGQQGNILAQQEVIKWIGHTIDDWIERYPQICKWKGYRDEVDDKIKNCIRCYRYTGSFLGYLFKTLEYSARGKPPIYSLDDKYLDGARTRIDYIVSENSDDNR